MQTTHAPARTEPSAAANTPPGADHAISKLRAAFLRRQPEEEGSSVFVHAPREAIVPVEPNSSWQRRFGSGADPLDYTLYATEREAAQQRARFVVFRDAACDVAEVTSMLGLRTTAEITIRLHPAELRDLAARLIDAAHDIEAHPGATLAPEREAA